METSDTKISLWAGLPKTAIERENNIQGGEGFT